MKSLFFSALVILATFIQTANAGLIINEVNLGDEDYIELVNTGGAAIDLQDYSINFYENDSDVFIFNSALLLAPGDILVVGEEASHDVNVLFNIPINDGTAFSIALYNASGVLIDFITAIQNINVPVGATFVGGPLADVVDDDQFVYQRVKDTHSGSTFYASDWTIAAPSEGEPPIAITTQVPEPSSLAIFALGVVGLLSRKLKAA
ncbi:MULTISPECIES: lamin tail domain-containing protein [Thalassotalea]|uniref:Lamin tail domain-containing protein n=1 Tax=Thalassotalea castellviae TaxID=3075612 RepID=A0ABU2ZZP0_9GAMM|nr:lamin tail domain-containing protein [Thalassotalea sp. W431]MDT0603164.1 lamin tail domain-containing protein [Thalassotalea sp. W431]